MARGWESKAVEEQQAAGRTSEQRASDTAGDIEKNTQAAATKTQDAHATRRRQELELQRERVLSERTSSPHRRAALTAALEEIELKLAEFGWTVHM